MIAVSSSNFTLDYTLIPLAVSYKDDITRFMQEKTYEPFLMCGIASSCSLIDHM